jgi:hypothetical protein
MKIKEFTLFDVNEPLTDELISDWKKYTSNITKFVSRIVEEDNFLRDKIDDLKLEWNNKGNAETAYFGYVNKDGEKLSNVLVVNIPAISKFRNPKREILFQLYKLPGERKNVNNLPIAQRQLNKWVNILGNDFFVLYPSYHSQLRSAGIQQGLMRNHPEFKEEIACQYGKIIWKGIPINEPLYNLGDVPIDFQGKSSLFKSGLLNLVVFNGFDDLAHYVGGTPFFSMSSAFALANAREMGEKLKKMAVDAYKLIGSNMHERLSKRAELIDQNTFDECYYPSLSEEKYLLGADTYLADCQELKEKMSKSYLTSLIKHNPSDLHYQREKSEFLRNTEGLRYVR